MSGDRLSQRGSSYIPDARPFAGVDVTAGDLVAMAQILEVEAARGLEVAPTLTEVPRVRNEVAKLLRELATGVWTIQVRR